MGVSSVGGWPMVLCFAAFVVTFLVTRVITRLIRSGKGPFKDNVTTSGVHIHHAVPGLVLLLFGAVLALGSTATLWRGLAGIAIGAGASLVLDEFALILHLQDVYWSGEGRASVQAVALVASCLGLLLLFGAPLTVNDFDQPRPVVIALVILLVLHALTVLICAIKGKYRLVLLSLFAPMVAWVAAARLARPGSPWFTQRYAAGSDKQRRAEERAARQERRWGPRWAWFADLIAGAPNRPDPPPSTLVPTDPRA